MSEPRPYKAAMEKVTNLSDLSRAVQSPDKCDTWVDLAGYAAVTGELVTLEGL